MTLRDILPAFVIAWLALAGPSLACTLHPVSGGGDVGPVADLEVGTFSGHLHCGTKRQHIGVWTLEIDPTSTTVGIRDEPLFAVRPTNPLREIARIGYDRDLIFTLFRRAETLSGPERPHRVFATLCEGSANPLDCSLGERRIKIRIDLRDQDGDGQMDRGYHQISIYDGESRLQVIFIDLPHDPRPHRMVAQWVETFSATGALDLDRVL